MIRNDYVLYRNISLVYSLELANSVIIILITPVILLSKGKLRVVKSRVWEACVGALMPLIEKMRLRIISSDRIEFLDEAYLINGRKSNKSKLDFEVGELSYCLLNRHVIVKGADELKRQQIITFSKQCRSLRNKLVHNEVPDSERVKSFFSGA